MTALTARASAVTVPPDGTGFAADWAAGRPRAMSFLPRHPMRESAWLERIAELERFPPAGGALRRAREAAARLGADAASLASADALMSGAALCVVTGQQPGLFAGPLYSLYKTWTAVALARRLERRYNRQVAPVFWNGADDSDFAEIASAVLPDAKGRLTRYALEGGDLPAGGMVGDLATSGTEQALARADADLREWPEWPRVAALVRHAAARAEDHGEITAALMYALLPNTGLVIVDGRWPELRTASSSLFLRYAKDRVAAGASVRGAGRRLQEAGYSVRIADGSTEQALFDARDGRRLAFEGSDDDLRARIAASPETLSPNVMLRPLLQDSLLPNVATVAGPGEVAYHAQIAPLYAQLGVGAPVLFPRFEATLVPRGVFDLAERHGTDAGALVRDFDATMKETAARALPASVRDSLDALEQRWEAASAQAREACAAFDDSLSAAADEMARRCREAHARLREKAVQAARAAEAKRDPSLRHYRDLLRPRNLPQERVLSALTLPLAGMSQALEANVADHVESAERGDPRHYLLPFRLPS